MSYRINTIPMPTWNHLKVNYAPDIFERDVNKSQKLENYTVSQVFDDMVSGIGDQVQECGCKDRG